MNPIKKIFDDLGGQTAAARICGVSTVAVHKWLKKGCLPRTDYTGKTSYAKALSIASRGRFTEEWILQAANPDIDKAPSTATSTTKAK